MKRFHRNRARLGGVLLAAALAAAAILALPGVGLGKNGHGPRPAGTIESFDPETGELIVDLAKGETISGLVVRRTRIRCGEDGRRHRRRHRGRRRRSGKGAAASRRGDVERGDDRGAPEDEAGDDRGIRGDEPGDDRGRRHGKPGDEGDRGDSDRGDRCGVEDLVEGAVVIKAEIVLTHGNAFYRKIGLLPPRASAPSS